MAKMGLDKLNPNQLYLQTIGLSSLAVTRRFSASGGFQKIPFWRYPLTSKLAWASPRCPRGNKNLVSSNRFMKCEAGMALYLSIRQPHAHALIHGEKRIEHRSWDTPVRGWVWIHASKSREDLESDSWDEWRDCYKSLPVRDDQLDYGAIIGGANLVNCIFLGNSPKAREGQCEFILSMMETMGTYCFIFENPRILKEPIPWKGNTGFQKIALDPVDTMFVEETT